jgi:uncharacterized protein YjeT (DUF2065 family)
VNLAWSDLLAALAILLVLEGLLPFLNPAGLRRVCVQLSQLGSSELRVAGFVSMALGLALLFFVRSNH